MVTKEQRRGTRLDLDELAAFVREQGEVDLGQIMMKFDWGHSKLYSMINAVGGRAFPDIKRLGTNLIHLKEPEEHQDAGN